jgi:hypothetical protein
MMWVEQYGEARLGYYGGLPGGLLRMYSFAPSGGIIKVIVQGENGRMRVWLSVLSVRLSQQDRRGMINQ